MVTGYRSTASTVNHWDTAGKACGVRAKPLQAGALITTERWWEGDCPD